MIDSAREFVRLRISKDPEEYRRAAHEEAPEQVWAEVIRNYPDMRVWVAHNKTVPLKILRVLAGDANPDVRWAVAMKRKLDQELFDILSMDEDESVRHRIACNKKTPLNTIERLADDPSSLVQEAAWKRLGKTTVGK